ncbi:MAG TPA: T9SS type A sorting domain-containing protein [Puia sp.]|jgi:hypothetical protein|nr:T9SS type A sorting domain-containing protein [Puia sp.]
MKKIYLLTTGLCFSIVVMAQSPGGVSSNLTLWLRADASSTLSSTDSLNSWTYFNNSNVFTSVPTNRPIVQNSTFNFLPSVFFNGAEQMDGPTGASAPIPAGQPGYAMFAVWSSNYSGATPQRIWSQRSTGSAGDGAAIWLYNGEYGDQPEISPYAQALGLLYSANQLYVSEVDIKAQNTNDCEQVDQTNISGSPAVTSTDPAGMALTDRNLSNLVNRLGARNVPTEEPFIGNLAELIVYNAQVDAGASRNRIFSYLAMKYGVQLGTSLLSSAGTTVWDAVANSTYNNSVFGLAVDNGSALNVQTSNSASTGGGSGTGQNNAGNITLSAYDPLTADQSFLMVGNDGHPLTENTFDMPTSAAGSSRLARNWWVQNTGPVGRVNLGFDLTGISYTGTRGTTSDFRLMVNSAGDNTFPDATTTLYTPSGFTGNVANFTAVTLSNGSVFAFITNASGSTPLPVNFISFTAQPNGENVDLNWVVNDNEQASSYEVDRSSDGVTFTKIAVLPNHADQTDYSFADVNAGSGTHYYRILETDQNGQAIYSKVVSAVIGAGDFSVAVLNNPAVGKTDAQLQINAASAGVAYIELWSVGGQRLSLQQQAVGTGTTTISVPMSNLAPGSYVVKVIMTNNTHVAQVVKM